VFIDQNRDDVVDGRRLGVEPICEVLQVAPSSYYAARARPPSWAAPGFRSTTSERVVDVVPVNVAA